MASGNLLFVSGHDPEVDGRLVYRGRVGRDLSIEDAAAAVRLATANALAAAEATAGGRGRLRRCLALTCFVDAGPAMLAIAPHPFLAPALALIEDVLGSPSLPVAWLRPANGLAGGMPVEVELLLELEAPQNRAGGDDARPGRKQDRRVSPRGARATRPGRRRSGRRTS